MQREEGNLDSAEVGSEGSLDSAGSGNCGPNSTEPDPWLEAKSHRYTHWSLERNTVSALTALTKEAC